LEGLLGGARRQDEHAFAMARFGLAPGVDVSAGWGPDARLEAPDARRARGPLTPYESYPKPPTPAPHGGVGVFVNVDLLKVPQLRSVLAALFGAGPPDAGGARHKTQ
jgi:hypothetical protein